MAENWRRFLALGVSDRVALAEAGALMALVCVGLRLLPFPIVRRFLRGYARACTRLPRGGTVPPRVVARTAWAVRAIAVRCRPGLMSCLVQALAAAAVLERHGINAEIHHGVSAVVPFRAHAWLVCGGRVIVGQLDNLDEYAVLAAPVRP
jgi:hypothetical protein